MEVRFCLEDSGEELYSFESTDIGGIIEASRGEKVVFQEDLYEYTSHLLNHHEENGKWKQHLIIYLRR